MTGVPKGVGNAKSQTDGGSKKGGKKFTPPRESVEQQPGESACAERQARGIAEPEACSGDQAKSEPRADRSSGDGLQSMEKQEHPQREHQLQGRLFCFFALFFVILV